VWKLSDDGVVYAKDMECVAKTLPEFLSRVNIEGNIHSKTIAYFCRDETPLTVDEQAYINHYQRHL
jgi:hypothetical protein